MGKGLSAGLTKDRWRIIPYGYLDGAGRPALFGLSGTWRLVIQLHELYETVLQSANTEIVTNCLTEGEAAKLNATAKRDAWRHLSAVDFNRNLGGEASIGVDSKQLVEMHAY
ncbi:hypothetical protein WL74_29435 [Burkholderia cepacia]|nr:hypothetical protein WK21_19715 [Burkholderia cepacia]KWE18358.1 hypothetical protein WL74_29435 [Burkholderia cepacia]